MAGGAVSGLVGGMLTPATTTLGAIANGVVIGAVGGFVDGAVAGGAYQLTYNALTPCTDWDENVLLAIGGGAVSGGIIGGVFGGIAGGWQFRRGASIVNSRPGYSGLPDGYPNKKPHDLNVELGLQNRKSIESVLQK